MDFLLQSSGRRALVGITLSLVAGAACADSPADERLLGLAEQDVVVAVPDVKKMARPIVGPHGLRGLLTLAQSNTTSLSGELTFYFRKSLLERIEERKRLPEPQCKGAYATLLASLSTRYGTGIYSDGDNAKCQPKRIRGLGAGQLQGHGLPLARLQPVRPVGGNRTARATGWLGTVSWLLCRA